MPRQDVLEVIIRIVQKGRGAKKSEKDLADLGKRAKGTRASLGRLAAAAGTVTAGFLTMRKALDITKEAAMLAARVTTLGVVTQQLGRNIGMTEPEIRKIEESIEDMGITTQASRQAVAMMIQSQVDLAKSTELARLAQDAAVIANTDSSDAFERLVRIVQTGNIRMARTIGLNVSFASGQKELANQLGVTTQELTQQQIIQSRVNTLLEAGSQITGTYEAAMQTAGKQMGSMNRLIEQNKLILGELVEGPLTAAVFQTNKWLKAMLEFHEAGERAEELIAAGLVSREELVELTEGVQRGTIDAATAHERYNAIIDAASEKFDRLEQEAASADRAMQMLAGTLVEGSTEMATSFDPVTDSLEEYTTKALAAQAVSQLFKEATADGFIDQSEIERIQNVADTFGVDLPDNVMDAVDNFNSLAREGIDPSTASAEDLVLALLDVNSEIKKLPDEKVITVRMNRVWGGGGGGGGGDGPTFDEPEAPMSEQRAKRGGQFGLDMTVPPGFPNDSFRFGATSGERIIVQTRDQQRRGQTVMGRQAPPQWTGPLIGTYISQGRQDDDVFFNRLKRVVRRS